MRPRAHFRGRNGTHRLLLFIIFIISIIAYCYYYMTGLSIELGPNKRSLTDNLGEENGEQGINPPFFSDDSLGRKTAQQCATLKISNADIDTVTTYPEFDFQPSWLRTREFWDKNFEDRYQQYINSTLHRPTLKVVIVPHSHNDPGWLKTFETYFELKTKNIINNIVTKLKQHPNMTFIWSEISYLNAWYESAHPTKQKALKKLIKEGRLEITTGGWVMPDEANTHIYSLLDQFIEGHLWLNNTLGISPTSGWSIDPFGHGPTVPYLLEQSGITGTIIQRIHYAWKQWLALKQIEDFHWIPGWKNNKRSTLVVHNQPFDIYSIKSSCGPHPSVCLGFDFRRIPGEYTEYSAKHEPITDQNLQRKAKLLVEEYKRIGSLTAHNIILVPLGDDFRYEHDIEFDEQYVNYMKLINYINNNKDIFKVEIMFGTPKDYFDGVLERQVQFPTLKGDFFVYADIYSEGKPAYWSGYFTTRPYLKILARQVEHNLRNAEILFTLVSNQLKQINNPSMIAIQKKLEKQYEQLIKARRNLGLFQHHDAITGTSKAAVMYDYGTKLFTSLYHTVRIQETALSTLLRDNEDNQCQLQSENEWETYGKQPHKVKLNVSGKTKKIVLFNSLGEDRSEVVTVKTNSTNVVVFDHHRNEIIPHQVNPNIHIRPDGNHGISNDVFDVLFIAELPALSTVTFIISASNNVSPLSTVFCNMCVGDDNVQTKNFYYNNQNFVIKNMLPGDIQLENKKLKLVINRNSGFLRQVVRKNNRKRNVVEIQFGAYQSAQRHSGAYLFMPDYESPERDVLSQYSNKNTLQDENIIIVSGPIATQITTMYLPFLSHTLRIFNTDNEVLSEAIYMESQVDFETPPKNRETELFMRIQTNIQNGDTPEMYTDQNGFQFQKRTKVNKLNIEGNYYPITTMAFIQDEEVRMTVVTDHAQGAAAYEPGRLELMLDRRMLYDDFRGMGEGVVDNKLTVYRNWLMFESTQVDTTHNHHIKRDEPEAITFQQILEAEDEEGQRQFNTARASNDEYQLPSFRANYLSRTLNYPINIFILDNAEDPSQSNIVPYKIFVKKFPKDIHLMTLRTLTDPIYDSFPSSSALMIIQKQAYSCSVGVNNATRIIKKIKIDKEIQFLDLKWVSIKAMSLTGLKVEKNLGGFDEVVIEPMEIKTYQIKF